MKTKILILDGNEFGNGKISGCYFKKNIKKSIKFYENALKDPKISKTLSSEMENLQKQFPRYYDEVCGKAFGAGVDKNAYFLMLFPEIFEKQDHCTTITAKDENGKFILSHNEDDNYEKGNFCLSKVFFGENWFVTNDIYNMPFGNGFSWNSFGIVKTINYTPENHINVGNISRYFAQRHISEAESLEDLIERCKQVKVASGFHVNALDIKNNRAVSVEVYPSKISKIEIENFFIHSNHCLRGEYAKKPYTEQGSNSIFRLEKATNLFEGLDKINLDNIKSILSYRSKEDKFENSIFQTLKDPYCTGMNFSVDTNLKDKIFLDVFVNKERLILDYDLSKVVCKSLKL